MSTYTLTIPAPMTITRTGKQTPVWLTANQRLKWRVKAARVRTWRNLAMITARNAHIPRLDHAQVTAHVHRHQGGRFDPSNWADTAKAALDGLVDAGILPDDDHTHVTGPDMRAGEPRTTPALVLTITQL